MGHRTPVGGRDDSALPVADGLTHRGRRVRCSADPVDGCPGLSGLVSFYFEQLDTWLVEDDEQTGQPRDPFPRSTPAIRPGT